MSDTVILSWVTSVYFGSFILYLLQMITGKEFWCRIASWTALAGFIAQTFALGLRWSMSYKLSIGHAPLSNFYESLIFFAWAIILLYLIVEWRTGWRSGGVFVTPLAFLSMAYASFSPNVDSRIQPLIPALQSNWLISHVVSCFLGYAAFAIAFCLGVMYLIKTLNAENREASRSFFRFLPEKDYLDELIYHNVVLGFILLTLGIVTGSIWAHHAWGSYWSWDPKESWSLITWLIYAVMLHSRRMRGWQGKMTAIMAIIGFAAVLFTYLGVNYLPGLHSYLQS
jgi:cytochrome c-type biogenesis protein CcsB